MPIGGEKNSFTNSGSVTIGRNKNMNQNRVHIMVKTTCHLPGHTTTRCEFSVNLIFFLLYFCTRIAVEGFTADM